MAKKTTPPVPESSPPTLERRFFAVGLFLLVVAVGFAIWAFAISKLGPHQRMILLWALPLASGFSAGAFVGGLTVQSKKNYIPGVFVTAAGGFAVWFLT